MPSGQTLKLDKAVEANLAKLPASQAIEVRGQKTTVGEIRRKTVALRHRSRARMKTAGGPGGKSAQERLTTFQADQAAGLDASNARVKAEVARLAKAKADPARASRLQAIRAEALQIQERLPAASPAQKEKDAARVRALYEEFVQLQ